MVVETVSGAKAHLSALIERVCNGEEVVIKKGGKPVVVMRPYSEDSAEREPGALRGRVSMSDDFDELPDDIARAFGARD